MRRNEVAQAARVALADVHQVSVEQVRAALADRVGSAVLDAATQEEATYWLASSRYWLDHLPFGDVVAFDQLGYNHTLGLYRRGL